jgi:hypothetical protein
VSSEEGSQLVACQGNQRILAYDPGVLSGLTLLISPSQTAATIEMFMISVLPQTEHLHRKSNGLTCATQLQLVTVCFIGRALLVGLELRDIGLPMSSSGGLP